MAIGTQIKLDGEREFRKALADINAGLRVTASELMLVTAKYSDNATSVQALTDKNDVLEKRIYSQTEKIAKLREALEASAREYGESDTKTMKWQVSLNKAEAELVKMEKDLEENSKELAKAKENMDRYGLSVDEAAESQKTFGEKLSGVIEGLGIHLPAGADKAIRALDGTKASTIALVGVVAGLVTGFGKLTIETAQAADEILTMSSVTGLATDTIQEMNYAAELLDVSADTITGSMGKMIRSMDDARSGSKDAAEAFRQLHLRVTDNNGQLKNSEQMFYEVIDALGRVKNETERDAIAMQIFGRSARELNPLIEKGSGALKELAEQAHEMGYVMSGDTLEAFGKLDDAMQMWDNQVQTLKNSLAMVLLPVLTSFFELLNKIDPKILATVAIIGTIATIGITVVKAVGDISSAFSAMNPAMLKTTAIIVGVTAGLIALAAIIAVIVGKSQELDRTMQGIGQSVAGMTNVVNDAPNRVRYSYASGIDYVPSDRVALIHKGEAVIPAHENPYNPSATNPMGGNTTIVLNVKMDEVDEVYKLVQVVKSARQTMRAGVVMA